MIPSLRIKTQTGGRMKKETLLANAIRTEIYMSQKELADELNVHENTVSNWVTGKSTISPIFFVKMKEMGIPIKALKNPSQEVT